MTSAQFKKEARKAGWNIFTAKTTSNRHGSITTITYSVKLSENAVSTEETRDFYEMTYSQILEELTRDQ